MEQTSPARHSSGIYDYGDFASIASRSTASLRGNAEPPAQSGQDASGVARTTPAGVAVGTGAAATVAGGNNSFGYHAQRAAPPPVLAPPPHVPFYKKRWFKISQIILIPLNIALIFILLFPVVRAIVQLVVNKSYIGVDVAAITSPQNTSFQLALSGSVSHTGVIPAVIQFTQPVNVSWVEGKTVTPIGIMNLSPISASHKRATLNDSTTFTITDEDAFGRFTAYMITSSNFTWRLESDSLRVRAAHFPVANGIKFSKDITLNGFNSFSGNVVLQDLQLPSDNPAGGINFAAVTQLSNPSPFSINLGTVIFALSFNGVSLGTGTGTNTQITPGNNTITLDGVLQPQVEAADLAAVSQLFTNYINGESSPVIAKGLSTLQEDGSSVSWLSEGLQSLQLTVPFKPLVPINPIKAINIGNFDLDFTQDTAWAPMADSNTVQATIELPFGFGISIGQIQNSFNITKDGLTVAGLATPLGASTSNISVNGAANTSGSIDINIVNTALVCEPENHQHFSDFNANLTALSGAEFQLVGSSHAVANMSIGQITLDPIKFNVTSSLLGLKGLNGMTTIESVDVVGGTQQGINLAINVSIYNPSNLKLSTGDLSLQLLRGGSVLGTTLLPNLTLSMGNNSFQATSLFEANNSPEGQQTLNEFVGKQDVALQISGFSGSTQVASLLEAFESLNIGVTLPGLTSNLLETASLEVLPTTGRENNISHVTVSLNNPFSAALDITQISSSVSAFGINLGMINSSTQFSAAGNTKTTSPALDLNMNFDPAALFTVTRALAVEAGLDVAPLDGIVQLGGIQYLSTTGSPPALSRRDNIYTNFNLVNFVQTAFQKLQSDVELSTAVTIGDYQTTLQYTQSAVPTITDDSLDLILPILAQPIVQKIVGGSLLNIDTVMITNPQQSSFGTTLKGGITNAGPFDATISFPSGLSVAWSGSPIGTIKMNDVQLVGDVGATINLDTTFEVADVDHLAAFSKVLLTEESFEWDISGENLSVSALGIVVPGIALTSKTVTLKGFNGLKNGVQINSFDLPANDPAGGISLTIQSTVTNPSQVGIELSSLGFDAYANNIMIAPVAANGTVTLAPQSTSPLSLVGRLVPQSSSAGLAEVSTIFNNFVHGLDSDVVVQGTGAGPSDVTWLNEAIQSLQVGTSLPNQGPLNVIKSIDLNELELLFTTDTAYNPSSSSNSTDAAFGLPFAFPIDITSLEQTLVATYNGQAFAELALPKAPSTTDVEQRIIHLTFSDVPFAVYSDQHNTFDSFVAATTIGTTETLHLSGAANADAQTAVGTLSLANITFSVDSTISGLQGLNTKPVTVSNLDVNHGYPDYLLITADSAIFNPSNLTIGTGDVSFGLQFQGQTIGSADISNLIIAPGNGSYSIGVHYSPQGGAQAAGQALLQNFLQGIDSDTTIAGSTDSTPIESLQSALSQIKLTPVSIPALHQALITSASLTFPADIVQTGIASATFTLSNPFTASINLLQVGSTVTFHGLDLGVINNVDISSSPIHADGHSNVTSSSLPLNFNLDPATIIQLLSISAQEHSVDLGPLVQLFQIVLQNPGAKSSITSTVDTTPSTCVSGNQFDVDDAVLNALKGLQVDLAINTGVKLDDFPTNLAFNQTNVTAVTDKTALYLIGAVAAPIAQNLVDGASLQFTEANITNLSDNGFDLALRGSLTNIGPLDALITFTEPVVVTWNGQDIATIALPPICAAANAGVPDYQTNAQLVITDLSQFTNFASYLLHNPSFNWTISTPKLRLDALGTTFDNVTLTKDISFKAFNGLPGVTISNFQLPGDDPAGGITIETDAMIPSASQLGIDLGTVGFQAYVNGTLVGPLSGNNLFLAANSITTTNLTGRIVPQSGSDVATIGNLFSQFLAGNNQTLTVKGESVQPAGSSSTVSWLSSAFQTLSLDVVLPGQKLQVIDSIALSDLAVVMQTQDQAYTPLASSNFTVATYKNPFGFSLQVVQASEDIILSSGGTNIAELKLPQSAQNGGVSTGNVVDLDITFSNEPLQSLNEAAFQALFAEVTLQSSASLNLQGTADVVARTTIGDIPISGIPFDVPSSLAGINAFGGTAGLSNISVTGSGGNGGNQYVVAPLTATLQNPSNVSLHTVDISLPVTFQNVEVGRASLTPFDLVPGENSIQAEFHYQPQNPNDTVAQSFLSEFLQTGNDIPLTIGGDSGSTPFASLQPALEGLHLSSTLKGLNVPPIVTHVTVSISLSTLTDNLVTVNVDLHNPLDTPLIVDFIQSDASVGGQVYAHFDQAFTNFVIPPGQTVNSGEFGNVLLTQGALASLGIIPLGLLDISAVTTATVGQGGYQIPWLPIIQPGVATTYNLDLSLSAMQQQAATINATSASTSKSAASSSSVPAFSSGGVLPTTSAPASTTLATSATIAPVSQNSHVSPNATAPAT